MIERLGDDDREESSHKKAQAASMRVEDRRSRQSHGAAQADGSEMDLRRSCDVTSNNPKGQRVDNISLKPTELKS